MSVDDFGTGNASIEYLATLPASELKIDRSFITGMLEDVRAEAIVRSTIDLARNLGLTVVAEGIETEAVMERLATLGAETGQGYPDLAAAARRGADRAADLGVRHRGRRDALSVRRRDARDGLALASRRRLPRALARAAHGCEVASADA